jgi:hypothetical protein
LWTEVSRGQWGAIIPGTDSYVCMGRVGGLRKGMAYKIHPIHAGGGVTSGESPFDARDWDNYVWIYDVQNLIDVKNGVNQPHDAMPYSYGRIDTPFDYLNDFGSKKTMISSASFDDVNNKLYITLSRGGSSSPLIAVYEIIKNRPENISALTGNLNLSWTAPTTRIDGTPLPANEISHYEIKSVRGREIMGNVYYNTTTDTSYTLPQVYETCKNYIAVVDTNGVKSDYVWNGVEPINDKFEPLSGGIQ